MKNPIDKLIKEGVSKISNDIDAFIVQRFIELFQEGILELSYELPKLQQYNQYPVNNKYTIHMEQNVWLRYKGDEVIEELKRKLDIATDSLELIQESGLLDVTKILKEIE